MRKVKSRKFIVYESNKKEILCTGRTMMTRRYDGTH